eukprot:1336279-Pyramimonas_sp.AAC.1
MNVRGEIIAPRTPIVDGTYLQCQASLQKAGAELGGVRGAVSQLGRKSSKAQSSAAAAAAASSHKILSSPST